MIKLKVRLKGKVMFCRSKDSKPCSRSSQSSQGRVHHQVARAKKKEKEVCLGSSTLTTPPKGKPQKAQTRHRGQVREFVSKIHASPSECRGDHESEEATQENGRGLLEGLVEMIAKYRAGKTDQPDDDSQI